MAEPVCDPKDVALAALTNLVRLMGAELVAGRHRDDIGLFERAVREKVGSAPVAGCSREIAESGIALAKAQTELALSMVRAQAECAKATDVASAEARVLAEAPSTIH